jgi:hypothetical protein
MINLTPVASFVRRRPAAPSSLFDALPDWARTIAPATPTYWVMRGFRPVILDGSSLSAILLPTVVLISMGLAFAAVSLTRFRFADA